MHHAKVQLIFWGSYWTETLNPPLSATAITAAADKILSGPYLTGASQYYDVDGGNLNYVGNGSLLPSDIGTNHDDPGSGAHSWPSDDDITDVVDNAIDTKEVPSDDVKETLYVVITPPGFTVSQLPKGTEGYHSFFHETDFLPPNIDKIHYAWVGNNGGRGKELDAITETFSHELVEAVTDPDAGDGWTVISQGGGLPPGDSGANEIADITPNSDGQVITFRYPDNKILVSAYWSKADDAMIVPLEASANFNIRNGVLEAKGDPGTTDHIVVDQQGTNLQVTVNDKTGLFSLDYVHSVNIEPGAGATVEVERTPAHVPISIDESAGDDTINVSPRAHNLSNILSGVFVLHGNGTGAVNVYDQADPSYDSYSIRQYDVTRDFPPTDSSTPLITYPSGSGSLNFYASDHQSLDVEATQGAPNGTPVEIYAGGHDSISVSLDKQNLANLESTLSVYGLDGTDSLILYDQQAPAEYSTWYTIKANSLERTVNYQGTDYTAFINYTNLGQVILNASSGRNVAVESSAAGTPVTVNASGYDTISIGLTARNVDPLQSALTVNGSGSDALTLDDSANASPSNYDLGDGYLQRWYWGFRGVRFDTGPQISWSNIQQINLFTTNGGNAVAVDSLGAGTQATIKGGSGDLTVNLGAYSHDLSRIRGQLLIESGSGTNTLRVDDTADNLPTTATLRDGFLQVSGRKGWQAQVSYDDALNSLEVHGGNHRNTFTVSNTSPAATTTLDCGTGGDEVDVQSTTGALEINGNSELVTLPHSLPTRVGTTTVFLGSNPLALPGTLAFLQGPVSIGGAAQSTALIIDDSGGSDAKTVTFGKGSIVGFMQVPIDYAPDDVFALKVYSNGKHNVFTVTDAGPQITRTLICGPGSTEVDVRSTTGALEIDGNSRFVIDPLLGLPLRLGTTVILGSSAPAPGGTLANILGTVIVHGAVGALAGSVSLVVDDSGDTYGGTVTVRNNAIMGLTHAPITYDQTVLNALTISTGASSNYSSIQVIDTPSGGSTTLNVGTNLGPNNGGVYVGGTIGRLFVNRNSDASSPVVQVDVGSLAPTGGGTLANIKGPVTFTDTAPRTYLVVDDGGNSTNRNATISNHDVRFSGGDLGHLSAVITYQLAGQPNEMWALVVQGGSGVNTFKVDSTANGFGEGGADTDLRLGTGTNKVIVQSTAGGDPTGGLQIRGGSQGGNNTVTVGSPTPRGLLSLANIHGNVLLLDDLSHTSLVVNNGGDLNNHDGSPNHPALNLWADSFYGFDLTNYYTTIEVIAATKPLSALTIYEGSGTDTFNVQGTVSGTTTTLYANVGNDTIDVRRYDASGNAKVKNVVSPLFIYGRSDLTTVTLDDSGSSSADRVTITPTQVGAAAGDNFFGAGGSLTYIGIKSMTVNAANNATKDTINLTPSATTEFFINAGSRSQSTLVLDLSGVTSPHQTVAGSWSGYWTFGNRKRVNYSGILDVETGAVS
jgi:hypothetical protein